jgi:PAS domain S-box-containing protein
VLPLHQPNTSQASRPDTLADRIAATYATRSKETPREAQRNPKRKRAGKGQSHVLDFMRAIIGTLGEGVCAVNQAGLLTFMNPAAERMLDWTEGELLGKDMHETIHFQRAEGTPHPREHCPLLAAIRSGEVMHVNDLFTRKDGTTIPVAYISSPLVAEGTVMGAVLSFQDISQHTRLGEAQHPSEPEAAAQETPARATQLAAIVDTMADGVLVYDREGRILRTNHADTELLRWDLHPGGIPRTVRERGQLVELRDGHGQPLPQEQWPAFRVLQGETLRGATAMDTWLRALDGRDILCNTSGAPVRDADGQIVGGVLILRDVTERRRQEQRTHEVLDALLAMAETLVSTAPDPADEREFTMAGIVQRLADLTRTVLSCERVTMVPVGPDGEVQQTVGVAGSITVEESQQWQTLAPPQGQRYLQDFLPAALIVRLQRGELIPVDRQEAPFNLWPNPLAWRSMLQVPMLLGGQLAGILTTDHHGRDLHVFTPDELALAAGAARLAALVLERNRLVRERNRLVREREEERVHALALTEANRRMDEFLGIATHELKTPVTSSSLLVELATDSLTQVIAELTAERDAAAHRLLPIRELVIRADTGLERLGRLMDDLLDVSRIHAGKLAFRLARCDLVAIVRDAVTEQRQIAPERTITLHLSAKRTVRVWADAERIRQVLTNLLTNALRYSPENCPVRVGLRLRGGWARVSVQDGGQGIPLSEQERIWQRFQRIEGIEGIEGIEVQRGTGLGLGLYIARTAIERHHGRIGVVSAPGRGSTFWFALPTQHVDG